MRRTIHGDVCNRAAFGLRLRDSDMAPIGRPKAPDRDARNAATRRTEDARRDSLPIDRLRE